MLPGFLFFSLKTVDTYQTADGDFVQTVTEHSLKPSLVQQRPTVCSVHFQSTHNILHLLLLELLRILLLFQTLQAKVCHKSRQCLSKVITAELRHQDLTVALPTL